jgi:predicted small lipoprotein YifL
MIFQNQILGFVQLTFRRYGLLGATCCASLMVAGCGQKGPLFLPTVPIARSVPAASTNQQTLVSPELPASAAR